MKVELAGMEAVTYLKNNLKNRFSEGRTGFLALNTELTNRNNMIYDDSNTIKGENSNDSGNEKQTKRIN